jgi:hypothetical protein
MYAPIIYEVTLINFTIGVLGLGLAYLTMDTLFYSLGKNIVNHLKILNNNLRNLSAKDFNGRRNRFSDLIEYHKKIIDSCALLNKLYYPVLLTQFVFAAVCIGMVLFQVVWVSFVNSY